MGPFITLEGNLQRKESGRGTKVASSVQVNPYNQHLFTSSDIRLAKVNQTKPSAPRNVHRFSLGEP